MIRYLLAFIMLSIGGVLVAFKGRKYEEGLPITIGTIIISLYIFYIFNILKIGYYVIIAIILALYLLSIYRFIKSSDKKAVLKNVFSPGFFIFVFSVLGVYFIVKDNTVLLWDELRLWGAYPKILFYNDKIQLGNNSQLMPVMQCYEPGMPLFQYFFSKTTFRFLERDLFISYFIFALSIFLPLCKKIEWKRWYVIPIVAIIFLGFPYILYCNSVAFDMMVFYFTLYIEPIMAIGFAYIIFLSLKKDSSWIHYLNFLVSTSVMVLMKDTGILFSIVAVIAFSINRFFSEKSRKKWFITSFASIVLVISVFVSWKVVQNIYGTSNMYKNRITKEEIQEYFNGKNEQQKEISGEFIEKVKNARVVTRDENIIDKHTNTITLSATILFFFVAIVILLEKELRKNYIVSIILYFVGYAIYMIGYYFLCVFSWEQVVCYQRYMSTALNAGVILIFMLLFDLFDKKDTKKYIIGLYFFVFLIFVFPFSKNSLKINKYKQYRLDTMQAVESINQTIKSNDAKIALVFDGKYKENCASVIYDHNMYYELIDEGFSSFDIFFVEDNRIIDENIYKYDFVYFFAIDQSDCESFSNATGINITESGFYQLIK